MPRGPEWALVGLTVAWAAWALLAAIGMAFRRRIGRDGRAMEGVNYQEVGGISWVDPYSVARELLMRLLTPGQQEQYLAEHGFFVETARARYHLLEGERVTVALPEFSITVCVVFDHELLPEPDRLIAILLMIRTEEELFLERFVWPAKRRVECLEAVGDSPRTICVQSAVDILPRVQRFDAPAP